MEVLLCSPLPTIVFIFYIFIFYFIYIFYTYILDGRVHMGGISDINGHVRRWGF